MLWTDGIKYTGTIMSLNQEARYKACCRSAHAPSRRPGTLRHVVRDRPAEGRDGRRRPRGARAPGGHEAGLHAHMAHQLWRLQAEEEFLSKKSHWDVDAGKRRRAVTNFAALLKRKPAPVHASE